MPLRVVITVKVEDGTYDQSKIEVSHTRSIVVQEGGYQDPQPKGYDEARAILEELNEQAMIDAQSAIDRAHTFDTERVQRERAKLAAEAK